MEITSTENKRVRAFLPVQTVDYIYQWIEGRNRYAGIGIAIRAGEAIRPSLPVQTGEVDWYARDVKIIVLMHVAGVKLVHSVGLKTQTRPKPAIRLLCALE